ncbi:helix-turn-helix domain-containing protein [Paenibacillus sp. LHD-117]|uniref:helix-turn-helix domain-containing protein n=1 Tax=Paenibacillus sp. LHD-117 TaxID=3071412 RepID=UPI0027E00354|nr:helix-turn-helix domain-containing protein [Paenibacillus sp. LHD-117]MDQ6421567.1 helix-turn-helix domain-containing protein [Paenibacillus sp. LHD-117]
MRHLLIVDDEAHWVDNLADHKPWDELGIDVVHKAYSPLEALELMDTFPIDIVISDIAMQELSGLELIEEIAKKRTETVCILFSGYSEFEYAKQAMRLNAFDYLLKPVKDEELFRVVRKALEQLDQRETDRRAVQKLRYTVGENLPLIRSHLLRSWLTGRRGYIPWREQAERYGLPFEESDKVWMMLLRLEKDADAAFAEAAGADRDWVEFAVLNIAEEWMAPDFHVWGCRDDLGYLVLLLKPMEETEGVLHLLERVMLGLQQKLKAILKEPVSLFLTDELNFPEGVHATYGKAVASFRQQVGDRQELILFESPAPSAAPKSLRTLQSSPTLLQLLEMSQWEQARLRLDELFKELGSHWPESLEHLLIAGMEISTAYIQLIHRNGSYLSQLAPELMASLSDYAPFRSIAALHKWSDDMFLLILERQRQEVQTSRQSIIRKVHQFIEDRLHADASLRAIADAVHVHPTHLSKIYKLETGQSLSEYMTNVRMDRACRLLAESGLKVYEICERVGYMDPTHFIKVFRKYYHMTPQEYRERHSPSSE